MPKAIVTGEKPDGDVTTVRIVSLDIPDDLLALVQPVDRKTLEGMVGQVFPGAEIVGYTTIEVLPDDAITPVQPPNGVM